MLRIVVTAFGGLVLVTLVVLIMHLLSQAAPLLLRPYLKLQTQFHTTPEVKLLATGDLGEGQMALGTDKACAMTLFSGEAGQLTPQHRYIRPCNYWLSVAQDDEQSFIVDVSPTGQVRLVPSRAVQSQREDDLLSEQRLSLAPEDANSLSFALPAEVWSAHQQVQFTVSAKWVVAQIQTPSQRWVRWVSRLQPTLHFDQQFDHDAQIYPLGGARQTLVIAKESVYLAPLNNAASYPLPMSPQQLRWWQRLPKERTLLLADNNSQLQRWVLTNHQGQMRFDPTYSIKLNHDETPVSVVAHASSNALALLTNQHRLMLLNRVTGEILYRTDVDADIHTISWHGMRLYGLSDTTVSVWQVNSISGITTWASLFEPQQYEGYEDAKPVWQTTSASDFQEAKYSLVPLFVGSLKAALLALVIAIPVSVGAAIYTGFFAPSRSRNLLKPAIEMLEAIPSVLIGFIAAIWLAPLAEQFLFSFAFFLVVVPVFLILLALVQRRISSYLPELLRRGAELPFSLLGIVVLGYISMHWAPQWIEMLFSMQWLQNAAEQSGSPVSKTTVVVAIALGVAISPSIYSLTEDAISGVPATLKQASFALGATRLQTLQSVVLRVASPGIMAAIMLGFGRAFGETMIVLMVTGNTPVASWSLFEGLRALTANLAIELPEADVGSTHYQILFFTACILFVFTFVVNTLAELLRQRLRRNAHYG